MLNYKKQSKIKILISLILATVLAVGFMFNTASAENTELIQVISQSDIATGEDNITRKDMAHIVARLCNPGADTTNRQQGWAGHAGLKFYGTKMDDKGDYEMVYNETLDGYERVFIPALVMDLENKLYDDSIRYCIENDIMTSDWFSDPDTTFTLQDAVKMLVNALKYDGIADSAYIKKASAPEVRLLGSQAVFPFTGVPANTIVTKNDAIMLAYNFIMSEYAVDVDGTVEVLKHTDAVAPNGMPLNIVSVSQPTTYRSVLQTFGADVAKPIASKVTVDGKEIAFDAYTINGSNYFKFLDIAYVLDGTPKQLSITLHSPLYEYGTHGGTDIVLGTPFSYNTQRLRLLGEPLKTNGIVTANDYEMSVKGTNVVTASDREPHRFYVTQYNPNIHPNDNPQALFGVEAYAINGEYYYKLRDLAQVIDISVEYDETSATILIDTNKSFPNRTPLVEDVNAYLR